MDLSVFEHILISSAAFIHHDIPSYHTFIMWLFFLMFCLHNIDMWRLSFMHTPKIYFKNVNKN